MNRVLFVPGAVLGAGVLLISGMREQFSVAPRSPMATITPAMGGLKGADVPIAKEERDIAGMSDFVMRSFGPDSSPKFTLYVGYYDKQVQGKSIHSPKNCLPGAGWEIIETKRIPLPGGTAGQTINHVILANKGFRALVVYWYQGRGRVEASEYKVKWNLLRDAAIYGRTEEALVRLVVPLGGFRSPADAAKKVADADAVVNALASRLSADVTERMPAAPGSSE